MTIPLKSFSEEDPELGVLWIGLPVTLPESTDDTEPHTLVQPNIPNRAKRTLEALRRAAQRRAEPQREEKQ